MFDLITIGDCTIDTFLIIDEANLGCTLEKDKRILCLNYAEKIPIVASDQSIGGNAANVAVGSHKLGLKTAIVTEVGDDINGHSIKHELERAGIDTRHVRMMKGAESRYSVIINYQSERTILSCHAKRNYALPRLPKTKWIYYTSLGKTFEKLQTKLLAYLKKNPKIKLAMNPGSYQLNQGIAAVRRILPRLDLLLVNKEEAERIIGKRKNIKLTCRAFLQKGVGMIAITDGKNGSFAADKEAAYFMPAYPIKPVAKTGAGDAYTSGFISALIRGESLPRAMQWGTANSSAVIQKTGAQKGLLNKSTLGKFLKKYKKIKPMQMD